MNVFEKSRWIWLSEGESVDSYADFKDRFSYSGEGSAKLNISVDSDYTLYVNGVYAASNQYGDYEHYKIYDELDVSELLRKGENEIKITVHYFGAASSRYRPAKAGLIYELISTSPRKRCNTSAD